MTFEELVGVLSTMKLARRFEQELEQVRPVLLGTEVALLHVVARDGYTDAAIVCGEWLIDIEGSDEPNRGHSTFIPRRAIERMRFLSPQDENPEFVTANPSFKDATLVLTVHTAGASGGHYWFAGDAPERESLHKLAKRLLSLK